MIVLTLAILLDVTAAAAQTAPAPEKPICRSFAETGSLVKKRRVCHTKAEWARLNERTSDEAIRLVEENRGRPPGQ